MPPDGIPAPGLGTMGYDSDDEAAASVRAALEMGYRHLDTAQKYGSEAAVGRGLAASSVDRDDVFLATKVAEDSLAPDDVVETARESVDRLGVETVDLLYVHWPAITYDPAATLPAFDDLREAGVTRAVGVCNFTPALLDEARALLDRPPAAVQVEMHPLLPQADLRRYVADHDMTLVAYCPLMRGGLDDQPELREIAADAGLTVQQLALAWLAGRDRVVPIPKATGEAHLRENLTGARTTLDPVIEARIDAVDREHRVVDPPEKGPWNWAPGEGPTDHASTADGHTDPTSR